MLAATIAAAVSLAGLLITKEQKVSEFRQAWIDGLRSDVSETVAQANAIFYYAQLGESGKLKLGEAIEKSNKAAQLARLRLNPTEPPSIRLGNGLKDLETFINSKTRDLSTLSSKEDVVVSACQEVLKAEWEIVKLGEPLYRRSRTALLYLIPTLGLLLILLLIFGGAAEKQQTGADLHAAPTAVTIQNSAEARVSQPALNVKQCLDAMDYHHVSKKMQRSRRSCKAKPQK